MARGRLRPALVGVLVGLVAGAWAVPQMLIFRVAPSKTTTAFDSPICDALANDFQPQGRVAPVVWSLTDPVVRAAVNSGKVIFDRETPTLRDALSVAGKLGAEYVLAADVLPGEGSIYCRAELYQRGRLVWRDPVVDTDRVLATLREMLRTKKITQEAYDEQAKRANYRESTVQFDRQFGLDDTIRSVARTWVEMMNSGPLRSLNPQVVKPTPEPAEGEAPPRIVAPKPDHQWEKDVDAAIQAGETVRSVLLLRDAVDVQPFDADRRISLIQLLLRSGSPEVAAKEARRAAMLMPDKILFHELAARSWIEAGKLDDARDDLNEAVARAPESPETRRLLAEVAIYQGDFASAIDHLNRAIATAPSGDAYYLRAVAFALGGQTDKAAADLKRATDAGLTMAPLEVDARYDLVAALFDGSLTDLGNAVRQMQQRAQVQRTDPEVVDGTAALAAKVEGRADFFAMLAPPESHKPSHERRVLAYKLLSQTLVDLQSYLKSGSEDVLTDSRINLGEALRQEATARKIFQEEQRGLKKSDAGTGG